MKGDSGNSTLIYTIIERDERGRKEYFYSLQENKLACVKWV